MEDFSLLLKFQPQLLGLAASFAFLYCGFDSFSGFPGDHGIPYPKPKPEPEPAIRTFKSLKISGKVPLDNYTELLNYFIAPFVMTGNKVEIEVSFKVNTSPSCAPVVGVSGGA